MGDLTRRGFLLTTALGPMVGAGHKANGQERAESLATEGASPPKPAAHSARSYNHLKRLSYVKKHLGWKMALSEHSMYMLIDEDRGVPTVGERTTPWGAPDAAAYVERIRRNLTSLEKIPGLALTYDFPGADIEAIARDFPDVITRMQEMHRKGVFDFVNGTYSSPNLQTLGSESNWRQFQYGLPVFEKSFGKKIRLFAFQETSLHEQLSQLLHRFGYTMLSAAAQFPWAVEIIDGPFELESSHQGTNFIHGDEFLEAQALDRTCLPFYLVHAAPGLNPNSDWNIKRGIERDLNGPPPIWEHFPDLEEVNQKSYDEISVLFDFVLLEHALADRVKSAPPRAKARIRSYWSYVEGVWAEELLRENRTAEQTALLAESIQAMGKLGGSTMDKNGELREIWRSILKYQGHDVTWAEATDLRRKAINYLADGITKSNEIMEGIAQTLVSDDQNSLAVFNVLPASRRAVVEILGKEVPEGGQSFQEFEGRSLGVLQLPAGGFKSFAIVSTPPGPSKEVGLPKKITTADYSITFSPSGLIEQITTIEKKDLLRSGDYLGGEMRAMIHDEWEDNRRASCTFYEGDVCYILTRSLFFGGIPVRERYFFFRNEKMIKVELEFDFRGNEVGYFWLDETKVNVYYPTVDSDIYYDIAFGYVAGRENRPLFPANWMYCGGLVYIHWGTVKHWVRNGVIANVLAWGGRSFGNRDEFEFWNGSEYDIRLYGKQKVAYALIPYGRFDGNKIVRDVNESTTPVFTTRGKGERSFYEVKDKELAVTAVYEEEGEVRVRGYRLPSERKSRYRNWEIFDSAIRDLA